MAIANLRNWLKIKWQLEIGPIGGMAIWVKQNASCLWYARQELCPSSHLCLLGVPIRNLRRRRLCDRLRIARQRCVGKAYAALVRKQANSMATGERPNVTGDGHQASRLVAPKEGRLVGCLGASRATLRARRVNRPPNARCKEMHPHARGGSG